MKRRRKKKSYLPAIAVPYDVKPDTRVEMLKTIAPKMLENPVSVTVDISLMSNQSVMMTNGRMR